jgi:hypothetical protein
MQRVGMAATARQAPQFLLGVLSAMTPLPGALWQVPARRWHGGSGRSHEKSPARQAALHFLVAIRSVIRSLPALRCAIGAR